MLDARRYARATVRCLPRRPWPPRISPARFTGTAPLPEPVIEPSPSNVRNQNNSRQALTRKRKNGTGQKACPDFCVRVRQASL